MDNINKKSWNFIESLVAKYIETMSGTHIMGTNFHDAYLLAIKDVIINQIKDNKTISEISFNEWKIVPRSEDPNIYSLKFKIANENIWIEGTPNMDSGSTGKIGQIRDVLNVIGFITKNNIRSGVVNNSFNEFIRCQNDNDFLSKTYFQRITNPCLDENGRKKNNFAFAFLMLLISIEENRFHGSKLENNKWHNLVTIYNDYCSSDRTREFFSTRKSYPRDLNNNNLRNTYYAACLCLRDSYHWENIKKNINEYEDSINKILQTIYEIDKPNIKIVDIKNYDGVEYEKYFNEQLKKNIKKVLSDMSIDYNGESKITYDWINKYGETGYKCDFVIEIKLKGMVENCIYIDVKGTKGSNYDFYISSREEKFRNEIEMKGPKEVYYIAQVALDKNEFYSVYYLRNDDINSFSREPESHHYCGGKLPKITS